MKVDDELGDRVIATAKLTKWYGEVHAVQEIDLEVRRGEIYGFLGLNGAGKTTTIRMLLGLVHPTRGSISIFGKSIERDRKYILRRIGFLVETSSAYPNLTVRENLEIQRRLHEAPKESVGEAIELLGLGEYADRRAGRLSLGNKQRLSLARALVHSPELLILDEPSNGLDPAGIVEIRTLLRRLASERGVTVFLSSHLLSEVNRLADRIGIVHQGRLVEELDYEELLARRRVRIELEVDDAAKAETLLRERLGLHELARTNGSGISVDDRGAKAEEIARVLVGAGIALKRLVPIEEDLEAHFLRMTGGES